MDEPLIKAFQFPEQSTGLQALARQVLRFRGWLLRWFPERRKPRLGTQVKRLTYPEGYRIEELGLSVNKFRIAAC